MDPPLTDVIVSLVERFPSFLSNSPICDVSSPRHYLVLCIELGDMTGDEGQSVDY